MERVIEEDKEFREVWFIYSPINAPWGNIRIATFTKAVNAPHAEIVVIHNEVGNRAGVRVWEDIVKRELWFKVRKIELPSPADVMVAAMHGSFDLTDFPDIPETTEDWFKKAAKLKRIK